MIDLLKLFSSFRSVIIVLLGLWYISNKHKERVSVFPMNREVGFAAPFAIALIFPCSLVNIKSNLSASPRVFDPKTIPLVLICFRVLELIGAYFFR